jgi:hypothetical protein
MKLARQILAVFCVATVFAELVLAGWMAATGQLTAARLAEARRVLTGEQEASVASVPASIEPQVSLDEVLSRRARLQADHDARESQLQLLRDMALDGRTGLLAQQAAHERTRQEFERRLKELEDRLASEAVEQTRGVLLALPPADAVDRLMALSLEEGVLLLKGMPEKSLARILKEFRDQGDPASGVGPKTERGNKIFEALSRGEPQLSLLKQAREGMK